MIGFLIGCAVGGTVGVFTACCCAAAGNADRMLEQYEDRETRHDR